MNRTSGRIKSLLCGFSFTGAYVLIHRGLLHLAQLPEDYCYFHSHESNFIQGLFLDQMGHSEPYGFPFILLSAVFFLIGFIFTKKKRFPKLN